MPDATLKFGIDTTDAESDLAKLAADAAEIDAMIEDPKVFDIDVSASAASFGGLRDQIRETADGFSVLKDNAVFDAIGKAGEFLGTFADLGREAAQSTRQLAGQTGLVGAALDDLKARAADAFVAGVGGDLAEARAAMGATEQQLGKLLSPDTIDNFLVKASGIGQTFDKETGEIAAKARTFAQNFQITDGDKLGNLVALGMQRASGAMDDVLDTLDEYSQLAVQAGFNSEEWIGTLVKGVELGARDTDKLADAIKETQIRLRAGDITTALKGTISPIDDQIKQIVALGEAGQISVKEVLLRSTDAINTAFDAGKISESMRSQLQVAISGTPAEDLGADLYGRIFGAPIDVGQVQQQAEQAGQQMADAVGNVSVFAKLGRQFDLVKTQAAELFAPLLGGASDLISTVSQIGPGLNVLLDKEGPLGGFVSSITAKLGPALGGLIPSFGAVGTAGAAAGSTTTAAFSPLIGTILPIVAAVVAVGGALLLAYKYSDSFREKVDGLGDAISTGFTVAKNYVVAFVQNAGPLLAAFGDLAKAYLNPVNWVSGDAIETAKKSFGDAIAKLAEDAQNGIARDNLGGVLDDALTIKGDLDKNNRLGELIERFKGAKTEAEKVNLAKQIQEQVPGAVSGIRQVVDAQGHISTEYDINVSKAEQFQQAQERALGSKAQGLQSGYVAGLKGQLVELEKNRAALASLGNEIVKQGSSGKDVSKLQDAYSDLQKQVNDGADAIGKTIVEGQKTGLVTGSVQDLAKQYGFSTEQAALAASATEKIGTAAQSAATDTKTLAESFNAVKQAAEQATKDAVGSIAEYNRKIREARAAGDRELVKQLQQQRAASLANDRQTVADKKALDKDEEEAQIALGLKKRDIKAKEVVSFRDIEEKALRETQSILAGIENQGINDGLKRALAEAVEKQRITRQGVADELTAIDKKLAEAAKKKIASDGSEVAARAALNTKLTALDEQAANDRIAIRERFVAESIRAEQALRDAVAADDSALLAAQKELLSLPDKLGQVKPITVRIALGLDIDQQKVDADLQKTLESRVRGERGFQQRLQQIEREQAARVEDGTITQAQAEAETRLQYDALVRGEIERRLQDQTSTEYALYQVAEGKKRQLAIEADKRITEERLKNQRNGFSLEENLLKVSLDFRANLYEAFFSRVDQARQADLRKQIDANSKAFDDLRTSLAKGETSYYDAQQQRADLLQQRRDLERDLERSQFDFFESVNRAASAAFGARIGEAGKSLSDSLAAFDSAKKAGEDTTQAFGDILASATVSFGAIVGQAAVDHQNIARAAAAAALDISLKTLEAQIPGWVVGIFGTSISELGPIAGPLVSAAITAAFYGLVGVAKSALSTGFSEGGYTGDMAPNQVAGVVHGQEFVHDHQATREYWEPITAIHTRTFEERYIEIERYRDLERQVTGGIYRYDPTGTISTPTTWTTGPGAAPEPAAIGTDGPPSNRIALAAGDMAEVSTLAESLRRHDAAIIELCEKIGLARADDATTPNGSLPTAATITATAAVAGTVAAMVMPDVVARFGAIVGQGIVERGRSWGMSERQAQERQAARNTERAVVGRMIRSMEVSADRMERVAARFSSTADRMEHAAACLAETAENFPTRVSVETRLQRLEIKAHVSEDEIARSAERRARTRALRS